MDFDSIVMHYLAAQGLLLSPQFSVHAAGGEWSCPDFVALDFAKREIQVVEITTAYNVGGLIEKIQNRQDQWFRLLTPQLIARGIPVYDWSTVVRAFVRRDRYSHVKSKFPDTPDVRLEVIEDITFPWTWPWDLWKAQLGAPLSLVG